MKKLSILICIFWMGFIFYMSSMSTKVSNQKSLQITNYYQKATNTNAPAQQNKPKASIKAEQSKTFKLNLIIRKYAHAFEYIVLAILLSNAFLVFNKKGKESIVYILFICLFYSVIDEFHQYFVPGRTSMVSDVLIDFSGSLIGLILFYLIYYKLFLKLKNKTKAV
ncbi:VanZ family protein [Clostridium swellfunianum]|uniref:VanZ family protein n=1 Tax=Clostridium swellfunianum TaxID=1367462 RepID=UPI0020307A82|nr:VanZ family protein [Clostridium swellfunianum]MCM0647452.1 VanZ family protein [Clostridium swellfunianum]